MIIKTDSQFQKVSALAYEIIDCKSRLPGQVFRGPFNQFHFEEFDWAMSEDFWPCLQQIAAKSQDPYMLMGVIEPHPVNYFYQKFGCYNWFELPPTMSGDDYWSVLGLAPTGSSADSLLFNSDVVVWLSPSKNWAIWGERTHGLCVLATRNTTDSTRVNHSWLSADEALQGIIPMHFSSGIVPTNFARALRVNYRSEPGSPIR
ncbi:hypothetical protein [Paenibacillus popilliae]|uniref:hypothetical protein n=1 Tax=Paenibacillus popilliae TaxID=78057 RepID=UPI0006983826|nr:hypothetical protein [Paenibacillus popilliae]